MVPSPRAHATTIPTDRRPHQSREGQCQPPARDGLQPLLPLFSRLRRRGWTGTDPEHQAHPCRLNAPESGKSGAAGPGQRAIGSGDRPCAVGHRHLQGLKHLTGSSSGVRVLAATAQSRAEVVIEIRPSGQGQSTASAASAIQCLTCQQDQSSHPEPVQIHPGSTRVLTPLSAWGITRGGTWQRRVPSPWTRPKSRQAIPVPAQRLRG